MEKRLTPGPTRAVRGGGVAIAPTGPMAPVMPAGPDAQTAPTVVRMDAPSCATAPSRRLLACAGSILMLELAPWTFVDVKGVDPTNNVAERAVRPAVLWRKGCFGNDRANRPRFTEGVLTVAATIRLRCCNVLRYLTQACARRRATGTFPIAARRRYLRTG